MKYSNHFQLLVAVFYRSTAIISSLAIFLMSSYYYGPEGRGTISFLTALYASLGLLLSFGIGRTIYQKITVFTDLKSKMYRATTRFIYALSFILLVLSLIFFATFTHLNPTQTSTALGFILFLGYFPYAVWQYISNFFYTASGKSKLHDKITIITRSIQVLILISLFPFKVGINTFIFAYGITSFMIYIVESEALLFNEKIDDSWRESLHSIYELRSEIKWPYIDSLAQMLAPVAVFTMGLLISKEALGHYNFALQIISTLYFPFWVVSIKIQENMGLSAPPHRVQILRKGLLTIIPISLVLMAGASIIPIILPHVGLSKFETSMTIMKWLLLTVPLMGFYYAFLAVWVTTHQAKFSSILTIGGGLINLLCILILTDRMGIWSGVLGVYLNYIFCLAGNVIYLKTRWTFLFKDNTAA